MSLGDIRYFFSHIVSLLEPKLNNSNQLYQALTSPYYNKHLIMGNASMNASSHIIVSSPLHFHSLQNIILQPVHDPLLPLTNSPILALACPLPIAHISPSIQLLNICLSPLHVPDSILSTFHAIPSQPPVYAEAAVNVPPVASYHPPSIVPALACSSGDAEDSAVLSSSPSLKRLPLGTNLSKDQMNIDHRTLCEKWKLDGGNYLFFVTDCSLIISWNTTNLR